MATILKDRQSETKTRLDEQRNSNERYDKRYNARITPTIAQWNSTDIFVDKTQECSVYCTIDRYTCRPSSPGEKPISNLRNSVRVGFGTMSERWRNGDRSARALAIYRVFLQQSTIQHGDLKDIIIMK
jgi:hypothetical protein